MAFPADYTILGKLSTVLAEIGSGTHTDFPALITEVSLHALKTNVFASTDNGGGDVRFSSDEAGSSQLSLDVFSWDTSGETCRCWIKRTVNSSTIVDVYIWGDNTGDSQPAVGASFGRNSVWSDFELVMHCGISSPVDSTGNHIISVTGSPSVSSTSIGDGLLLNSGNAGGTATQWFNTNVGTLSTTSNDIYQSINFNLNSSTNGQKIANLYDSLEVGSGSEHYIDTSGGNTRGVLNNSGSFIASDSTVTGVQKLTQFTDTSQRFLRDGSLLDSSSEPGTFEDYDCLVIGKNGQNNDQAADITVVDYFYAEFTASTDLDLTFSNNQLDPGAFWTASSVGAVNSLLLANRSIANFQGIRQ